MAHCPACGKKLHLFNWKSNCPHCSVNLNYYKANEILLEESERSEIEHAKFQPKVDRGKQSTIGSKTGIIRMVFFLIPIAAVFLPLFRITVGEATKNYNAITLVNLYSSLDTGKLFGNITPLLLAILFIALPAVCCIVFTILQLTAGTKKGLKRNIAYSSVFLAFAIGSVVCLCMFASNPADTYTEIVANEAEFALSDGDQETVDTAVQKLRDIYNDKTVDTSILERAVAYGEALLNSDITYGLTQEELTAVNESVKTGKDILESADYDIDTVRDAANEINTAVNTYSPLQTSIYAAINDGLEEEDAIYSDECLADLKTEIENARINMQYAVDRAKLIENNGIYSEGSYNNLQTNIETVQQYLDLLNNGELIVELEDDDGSGDKTEKELAQETAETLQGAFNGLNDSLNNLVDISVLTTLTDKVNGDIADGSVNMADVSDIKASIGIGVIIFTALYLAQLIFNIIINKKGFEIKYTECLIGGMPSEKYYELVKQGLTTAQIRRKMLVVLAEQQNEFDIKLAEEEEKARQEKLKEIEGAV